METQKPWVLSVITCAAPYAPAVGQPTAGMLLRRRIHRVLAIAQAYEHSALVLGAWGCGAFRNDPQRTAVDFRQALLDEYRGAFSDIVFAIADWSPERKFLGPFRDNFRPGLFVSIPDELAQDPWYKVVDFLQQNWAVVIATGGDSVLVVFYGDTSGIFDELEFRTREEAEKALLRNGFSKYQEDTKSHQFIGLPQGNFMPESIQTGVFTPAADSGANRAVLHRFCRTIDRHRSSGRCAEENNSAEFSWTSPPLRCVVGLGLIACQPGRMPRNHPLKNLHPSALP